MCIRDTRAQGFHAGFPLSPPLQRGLGVYGGTNVGPKRTLHIHQRRRTLRLCDPADDTRGPGGALSGRIFRLPPAWRVRQARGGERDGSSYEAWGGVLQRFADPNDTSVRPEKRRRVSTVRALELKDNAVQPGGNAHKGTHPRPALSSNIWQRTDRYWHCEGRGGC